MPYTINSGENVLFKFTLIELTAGLVWKGVWDGATAYVVNDAVLGSDGNGYKCILGHTNHAPPNATYWTVLATIPALNVKDVGVELVDSNGKPVVTYLYRRGGDQVSGLLTIGQRYVITDFNSGDDFSNCGATNVTGNVFVATNNTPTDWTHASVLQLMMLPANIVLTDGLVQVELLRTDTVNLNADYELRVTISFVNPIYVQSGAQTDVLCLPEAITITPCGSPVPV